MSRYYAGNSFFRWLRTKVFKIEKPHALPLSQWSSWEEKFKDEHPFAFFLTESIPDVLEKIPEWTIDPIMNVKYYLANRFVSQTHKLQTRLKPGKWYDADTRITSACFETLVDYVEIELADRYVSFSSEKDQALYNFPWWTKYRLTRWVPYRCKQAGLASLKWACTLDDPSLPVYDRSERQAECAREISIIYFWYTQARIKQEDIWKIVGLDKNWDEMEKKYGETWIFGGANKKVSPEDRALYDELTAKADKMEKELEQTEDDMLIRLIKVRRELWS